MRKVTTVLGLMACAGYCRISYADDPKPEVAKIVAEIAARRAEKDEAQAKAAQAHAAAESRERASSNSGQTRVINLPGAGVGGGTTIILDEGDDD